MTDEEKVLFLFAQTCSVISVKNDLPQDKIGELRARKLGTGGLIEREFDSVYAALEKKLAEKLSN
ncbi:hypothetical protein J9K13_000438 [Salmonella enterica]|nr:hypothetical protein [Salmonella enterica]EHK2732999.1 hypothetical protein [Salmonella enterica]HEC8454192.1 hypothetical protein [Salmonella enterica subsp. enterica serovar Poona]